MTGCKGTFFVVLEYIYNPQNKVRGYKFEHPSNRTYDPEPLLINVILHVDIRQKNIPINLLCLYSSRGVNK